MNNSLSRILSSMCGLSSTLIFLCLLTGCGGHSESENPGITDNTLKPIVKFSHIEKPNVSASSLNSPGELKAFFQFDDHERQEMAVDNQKASLTIENLTTGDHTVSIFFEFHSPEYGEITIASAVKQIEIHPGENNISITAEDYEIASFDNDKDGISNLDELSNTRPTNPNIANNYPPNFVSSDSISLPENTLSVMQVIANDANDHLLTYSISGGSDADLFSINPETGELNFLTAPNYEEPADSDGNNIYLIELEVIDEFRGRATQTLSIEITDSETESEPQNIHIVETAPGTMLVGDVFTLNITRSGEGAITFHSSNESVITIDERGLITALTPGSTDIEINVASDGEYVAASTQFTIDVIRDPHTLSVIRSIILDD